MAHGARQIGPPGVQDEVVVIAHQAVRQQAGVGALQCVAQNRKQDAAVVVILEDGFATITARSHVVRRAGKLDAQGAGHAQAWLYRVASQPCILRLFHGQPVVDLLRDLLWGAIGKT